MRAWVDNQKGVGYVVCWLENHINTPLRNFRQYLSAAARDESPPVFPQKEPIILSSP